MARISLLIGLLAISGGTAIGATPAEIAAVKAKVNSAIPYFLNVWREILATQGLHFEAPPFNIYSSSLETGCGHVNTDTAFYCRVDKKIYLGAGFLANQVTATSRQTHTDGDYAAIVIAAHELGHAVHAQLVAKPGDSFTEEQTADCFAGAVTLAAKLSGRLDPGDLEEARFSLLLASDFTPVPGGMGDLAIRTAPGAHGNVKDRRRAFHRGYYVGAATCTGKLGSAAMPPGGRVLFEDDLKSVRPAGESTCSTQAANSGVVLKSTPTQSECHMAIRNFGTIPDHTRIEATLRVQNNGGAGAGFFFGPLPHGFNDYYAAIVRPDGSVALKQFGPSRLAIDSLLALGAKAFGPANRITVDIHREPLGANMLLYINGKFAGNADVSFSTGQYRNEQAGPYLEAPRLEAAFTGFRVVALTP